jgi:pyruvate kinase
VRRAKILATLGPASREPTVVEALMASGVNGVRINMSHGTQDEHTESVRRARSTAAVLKRPLAILVDLSGPKLRTGVLKGGQPVQLETNALFTITTRSVAGDAHEVSTNYAGIARDVKPGARLLLDDGAIELRAERTTETDVICRVINGGTLAERKGINLPGVPLPIPSLTDKDRRDLQWAVRQGEDYIPLSFVRRAADCIEAKALIEAAGGKQPLVAKIEKAEAMDHLDEIIAASDGIMVARGDLGVETSVEHVPVYQKRIIEQSNIAEKFVITATQMLQSMVSSPRPTRAESTDVANAVWDGTDCLMLSNETAMGQYPALSVATMARIIETAEMGRRGSLHAREMLAGRQSGRFSRALSEAAAFAAEEMNAKTIVVFTESGLMARRLATIRPDQRIIALTPSEEVRCELSLVWGIESLIHPKYDRTEEMVRTADRALLESGIAQQGEVVVVMAGRLSGLGLSSSMKLHRVGEDAPQQ